MTILLRQVDQKHKLLKAFYLSLKFHKKISSKVHGNFFTKVELKSIDEMSEIVVVNYTLDWTEVKVNVFSPISNGHPR